MSILEIQFNLRTTLIGIFGILIFIILYSCNHFDNEKQQVDSLTHFEIVNKQLDLDTTINQCVVLGDYLVCQLENNQIVVFDRSFKRNDSLEKIIASHKINGFTSLRNGTIAFINNTAYLIDSNFKLHKFNQTEIIMPSYLYEDDSFFIYGCCAGESGGAIFFEDKFTNKVYSYIATCPIQVLKIDSYYLICNSLHHMIGSMYFIKIEDPRNLFKVERNDSTFLCNWYLNTDTIGEWKKPQVKGLNEYADTFGVQLLLTFQKEENIFSLLNSDSSISIVRHNNDSLEYIQEIDSFQLYVDNEKIFNFGSRTILVYRTKGQGINNVKFKGNRSSIIAINGEVIEVYN